MDYSNELQRVLIGRPRSPLSQNLYLHVTVFKKNRALFSEERSIVSQHAYQLANLPSCKCL